MLIDLDRFRSVNDTLGHLAGDRLLLQIADRLRLALPRGAEAARLGGDEFAVLLPVADSTTQRPAGRPQPGRRARLPARPRRAHPRPGGQRRRRRLPRPRARRGGAAAARGRGDVPGEAGPYGRRGVRVQAGLATPPTGSACWAICGARSTRARSSCTTSPRSASTDRSPGLEALVRWVHPERGQGAAGRVHRDRRVVRADAPPHGVRAGDGARPGRAVARPGAVRAGRGQRLAARRPHPRLRRIGRRAARPARGPAGRAPAGDNGTRAAGGPAAGRGHPGRADRARREDVPGRLRHRVLLAGAPAAAAGQRAEDRPVVRGPARGRQRGRGDRALHGRPRPLAGPAGRRRGRRGRRDVGAAAGPGLRRGAGLAGRGRDAAGGDDGVAAGAGVARAGSGPRAALPRRRE